MSQSRDLHRHIGQLQEIRTILNAMKNMAFTEIHKLARQQNRQSRVVANIENAGYDLLHFFPDLLADLPDCHYHLGILLGTERGFCGDFNERLIQAFKADEYAEIIAIGGRVATKLGMSDTVNLTFLVGANTTEEIPSVINLLSDEINEIASRIAGLKVSVIYQQDPVGSVVKRQLMPPFSGPRVTPSQFSRQPPLLNLPPEQLLTELTRHYLFALLHEVFYLSFMAENQSRLQHLDSAVKHLEEETGQLNRKLQRYRQEEITEEIEVILLNIESGS